jgi:hypothetical protein
VDGLGVGPEVAGAADEVAGTVGDGADVGAEVVGSVVAAGEESSAVVGGVAGVVGAALDGSGAIADGFGVLEGGGVGLELMDRVGPGTIALRDGDGLVTIDGPGDGTVVGAGPLVPLGRGLLDGRSVGRGLGDGRPGRDGWIVIDGTGSDGAERLGLETVGLGSPEPAPHAARPMPRQSTIATRTPNAWSQRESLTGRPPPPAGRCRSAHVRSAWGADIRMAIPALACSQPGEGVERRRRTTAQPR